MLGLPWGIRSQRCLNLRRFPGPSSLEPCQSKALDAGLMTTTESTEHLEQWAWLPLAVAGCNSEGVSVQCPPVKLSGLR